MHPHTHTHILTQSVEAQTFSEASDCVWHAYSHKENDSGVGHGKSQTQNSTAHYGVAEVKDGHAK